MLQLSDAESRVKREVAAARDAAVRTRSVHVDIGLDLPPRIALSDGEEVPYSAARRMRLRHPDQEQELVGKCIRPPPNRTVYEGESPPPYRAPFATLHRGQSQRSESASTNRTAFEVESSDGRALSRSAPASTTEPSRRDPTESLPEADVRLSGFASAAGLANLTMVPCRSKQV